MLGHKTTLNQFKKTEIISSIFSDQKSIRLEINYKQQQSKHTHTHTHTEAKQYATQQPMGHWRNQKEYQKYLDTGLPWWRSGWESAC